jgi:hypothetical protein
VVAVLDLSLVSLLRPSPRKSGHASVAASLRFTTSIYRKVCFIATPVMAYLTEQSHKTVDATDINLASHHISAFEPLPAAENSTQHPNSYRASPRITNKHVSLSCQDHDDDENQNGETADMSFSIRHPHTGSICTSTSTPRVFQSLHPSTFLITCPRLVFAHGRLLTVSSHPKQHLVISENSYLPPPFSVNNSPRPLIYISL